MSFQWDSSKATANRQKHGIDFADVVGVFEDPRGLTRGDPDSDEERFVTLGLDWLGRILVVAWTVRGHEFRIISARKATPRERKRYTDGD